MLLKTYHETKRDIPSEEEIAKELGITLNRLKTALSATRGLLSIDSPLDGAGKGSMAGGDNVGEGALLISDTLQW